MYPGWHVYRAVCVPRVDGATPITRLVQGTAGNLYGTTQHYCSVGDFCDGGTVFRMTPDGALTVLFHFPRVLRDEFEPYIGGLTEATDGGFYGIVRSRGSR